VTRPKGEFVPLREAFQFLTVLPVGTARIAPADELQRSRAYFPLVGACLGAIAAIVDLATRLVLPPSVTTVLVLAVLAFLTGGLHLDGLMDSCDGLFGWRTSAERLAIMRDSRVGSYGVTGGVLVLLLQFACLSSLTGWLRTGGIVAMTTLGRWAMVYATVAFPYARAEGLGTAFTQGAGRRELVVATLLALAIGSAALGPGGPPLLVVAWLTAWLVARATLQKLPGLTGDSYGAINEVVTSAALLALAAYQEHAR
jgi:adenosylcobinamide-GDP ribazoletransferase